MEEFYAYHVVTDKPMQLGQHIIFDESHPNGVWKRVNSKLDVVNKIYQNPQQYDAATLEHHTSVAIRELALEEIRQKKYPKYPSRMHCLYVSATLQEAEKWCQLFIEWGRPTYHIVKLKISGNCFCGNANLCFKAHLTKKDNLILAEQYWKNESTEKCPPIWEWLVDGNIEVVAIMRHINANL